MAMGESVADVWALFLLYASVGIGIIGGVVAINIISCFLDKE